MTSVTAKETMGHTIAQVRIRATGGQGMKTLDLLVDTGATYSWIRGSVLRKLGVIPSRRMRFETIEGRKVSRQLGEVVVEYGGERATTVVVFAREGDFEVLGAHALEGLAVAVDPRTKRLRRLPTVLAV